MNLIRWTEHFQRNREGREEPTWDAPMGLPEEVVRELVPSLEQFELGDGGGPAYLIAWDRERFLAQPGARDLVDLWFREEEEHSRLLGCAVQRFGGTSIEGHWSFSLFCGVRRCFGVRFELLALLLTEIVSNVYYKLLLRHGGDRDLALGQLCQLVIRDETGHIAFHQDRWARRARGRRLPWGGVVFRMLGMAAGTTLWVNHRRAVSALGGTTREFYSEIWSDMSRFLHGVEKRAQRECRGDFSQPYAKAAAGGRS
ncbi:MAG: hypothetical protein AAF191_05170 [Verrucomicrobiota bacterium]